MANKVHNRKIALLLFEEWKSSLLERDKSKDALEENFDDLFYEFEKSAIDFDTAHEFLEKAIAAHYPNKSVINRIYKRVKSQIEHTMSKDEFEEDWKRLIYDTACKTFYSRFKLEKQKKADTLPSGMSRSEYKKQRAYADSFPELDLSQLPEIETNEDIEFSLADLESKNDVEHSD